MLLFWILLIQMLGGFVAGVASFGSNLIAIPLLTLLMDFKDAVIMTLLALIPLCALQAWLYRKAIIWREIIPLTVASFAGGPAGTWILAVTSPFLLQLGAALAILFILAWQLCNRFIKREGKPAQAWLAIPVGLASGIFTGSIGMGGPPAIIYAYLRRWSKETTIGGLAFCFMLMVLSVIPAQWREGLMTPELFWLSIWGAIASIIGVALAFPVLKSINEKFFRGLLLAILGVSALTLLTKALLLV